MWYAFLILIIIGLVAAFNSWTGDGIATFLGYMVVGVPLILLCNHLYKANFDPEYQAEQAEKARVEAEAKKARETPHVIREANGCKVYQFEAGGKNHYFTQCPNSTVSTDRNYEECTSSGKSRSCKEMTETIVTK